MQPTSTSPRTTAHLGASTAGGLLHQCAGEWRGKGGEHCVITEDGHVTWTEGNIGATITALTDKGVDKIRLYQKDESGNDDVCTATVEPNRLLWEDGDVWQRAIEQRSGAPIILSPRQAVRVATVPTISKVSVRPAEAPPHERGVAEAPSEGDVSRDTLIDVVNAASDVAVKVRQDVRSAMQDIRQISAEVESLRAFKKEIQGDVQVLQRQVEQLREAAVDWRKSTADRHDREGIHGNGLGGIDVQELWDDLRRIRVENVKVRDFVETNIQAIEREVQACRKDIDSISRGAAPTPAKRMPEDMSIHNLQLRLEDEARQARPRLHGDQNLAVPRTAGFDSTRGSESPRSPRRDAQDMSIHVPQLRLDDEARQARPRLHGDQSLPVPRTAGFDSTRGSEPPRSPRRDAQDPAHIRGSPTGTLRETTIFGGASPAPPPPLDPRQSALERRDIDRYGGRSPGRSSSGIMLDERIPGGPGGGGFASNDNVAGPRARQVDNVSDFELGNRVASPRVASPRTPGRGVGDDVTSPRSRQVATADDKDVCFPQCFTAQPPARRGGSRSPTTRWQDDGGRPQARGQEEDSSRSPGQKQERCPRGHDAQRDVIATGGRTCDKCGYEVQLRSPILVCDVCNYTTCSGCQEAASRAVAVRASRYEEDSASPSRQVGLLANRICR